jgi:hypothetical protein
MREAEEIDRLEHRVSERRVFRLLKKSDFFGDFSLQMGFSISERQTLANSQAFLIPFAFLAVRPPTNSPQS